MLKEEDEEEEVKETQQQQPSSPKNEIELDLQQQSKEEEEKEEEEGKEENDEGDGSSSTEQTSLVENYLPLHFSNTTFPSTTLSYSHSSPLLMNSQTQYLVNNSTDNESENEENEDDEDDEDEHEKKNTSSFKQQQLQQQQRIFNNLSINQQHLLKQPLHYNNQEFPAMAKVNSLKTNNETQTTSTTSTTKPISGNISTNVRQYKHVQAKSTNQDFHKTPLNKDIKDLSNDSLNGLNSLKPSSNSTSKFQAGNNTNSVLRKLSTVHSNTLPSLSVSFKNKTSSNKYVIISADDKDSNKTKKINASNGNQSNDSSIKQQQQQHVKQIKSSNTWKVIDITGAILKPLNTSTFTKANQPTIEKVSVTTLNAINKPTKSPNKIKKTNSKRKSSNKKENKKNKNIKKITKKPSNHKHKRPTAAKKLKKKKTNTKAKKRVNNNNEKQHSAKKNSPKIHDNVEISNNNNNRKTTNRNVTKDADEAKQVEDEYEHVNQTVVNNNQFSPLRANDTDGNEQADHLKGKKLPTEKIDQTKKETSKLVEKESEEKEKSDEANEISSQKIKNKNGGKIKIGPISTTSKTNSTNDENDTESPKEMLQSKIFDFDFKDS